MRSAPASLAAPLLFAALLHGQAPALPAATAPVIHSPFPSGKATPLGRQIADLLANPAVSRAHWGIAVTTLDGQPLLGLNEGQLFRPASNNKIFTTAAAMHLLGPTHSTTTSATLTAVADSQGNVQGDIVLKGAGDGTFSSGSFPYVEPSGRKAHPPGPPETLTHFTQLDQLAAGIAAAGVHHISGNVIGDDTLWPFEPYATGWELDDLVWGYGAPVSALTIQDNQLILTVNPGPAAGLPPTVVMSPDIGYYQVQLDATTVAATTSANLDIDRTPGSHLLRIVGTIPVGKPDREEIAIDDPADFAAQALRKALEAHGITIDGQAVAHHRPVSTGTDFSLESHTPLPSLPRSAVQGHPPATPSSTVGPAPCAGICPAAMDVYGPPLSDDIKLILKVSQNLHTELLLHTLGATYGTDGSTAQGVRVVRQLLLNAGLDPADFFFYDGSGLSSHDLVAPRAIATFLAYAASQPWFPAWKASLPEAGVDGGLDTRFPQTSLRHHLFAKTGTLGETHALSGYLDAASGRPLIFSILVDTHTPGSSADRVVIDKIAAAIAAAY